jgi:hypothetical protein
MIILKHYGKNLDDLDDNESKLLYIDTLMTSSLLVESIVDSKLKLNKSKQNLELCESRTLLIAEILGLKGDFEEIIEEIEYSRFSYKKFVIDMRENQKKQIQLLRQAQLN